MAILPLTKAFQHGELPIGSVIIYDEQLEWITKALVEQSVEFACAFRGSSTDNLRLMEVSIIPKDMHLKRQLTGVLRYKGENHGMD